MSSGEKNSGGLLLLEKFLLILCGVATSKGKLGTPLQHLSGAIINNVNLERLLAT